MHTRLFFAVIASAAMSFGAAQAATFVFSGPNANLGKDEVFTSGPDSVLATAINTQEPKAPTLRRNGAGIGVKTGFFDTGQVDNIGDDEAIVFDFGGLVQMGEIVLTQASFFDDIRIYGTNDATVAAITSGGLPAITSISTLLASATGVGLGGTVTIDLSGIATAYRFLIATIPGGSGDGFRVKEITVSEVPLPAALPLMAFGLAGLGFVGRRRRKLAV
jgi:hypothetical protein